jgi:hypothetical protein
VLPRACRRLNLGANQVSGSFPLVVSGLSSLQYVLCICCVCSHAREQWRMPCVCVMYDVHLLLCVRALHVWWCVSECVGAWCVSGVVVVSVCGRNSSMRGSAVSTPAVAVSGDAFVCAQVLGPVHQPDQRQLSVGGVRAVFVDVRACVLCVFACAWVVCDVHVWCTVCICFCVCVRCM